MTDKERLEQIKHNHMVSHQGSVKTTSIDLESMEWLIEQVEKMQEVTKDAEHLAKAWTDKVEENRKLREALEFYADRENYKLNENYYEFNKSSDGTTFFLHKVDFDEGIIARQVLESLS